MLQFTTIAKEILQQTTAPWSNGRTAAFEAVYLGSNPSGASNTKIAEEFSPTSKHAFLLDLPTILLDNKVIVNRMSLVANTLIKFFKNHFLLILILAIATLIRLYNLRQMAQYDFDQEYVTNFVLDVVREYPIRYAGQGLSIQGLFMGAWYFYFLLPFYLITNLNPIGGFIGSSLLGVLIVWVYYYVGKEIFSKNVGLIAAFLRAIGFYAINADWSMVPSYSSDLSVLLTWYCFYKIYKGRDKFFYLLALIFGLFTSFHIIQFPFYLVLILLLIIWKVKVSIKVIIPSLIIFLLPNIPLILFDYWRNWAMAKQILGMVMKGGSEVGVVERLEKLRIMTWVVIDFFGELTQVLNNRSLLLIFFLLVVFLLNYFIKSNKKFHFAALISTFLIFVFYYTLLPSHVPEYYLRGLQAIMLIYFSFLLNALSRHNLTKYLVFIFIIYYSFINLGLVYKKLTKTNLTTLGNKEDIVSEVVNRVGDEEFAISYIVKPGWGSGFDSLFRLKNKVSSGTGKVYTIVSPIDLLERDEIDFIKGNVGLVYPKDLSSSD